LKTQRLSNHPQLEALFAKPAFILAFFDDFINFRNKDSIRFSSPSASQKQKPS
jgi:hypothetical protein